VFVLYYYTFWYPHITEIFRTSGGSTHTELVNFFATIFAYCYMYIFTVVTRSYVLVIKSIKKSGAKMQNKNVTNANENSVSE